MVIDRFEFLSIPDGLVNVLLLPDFNLKLLLQFLPALGNALVKILDLFLFLLLLQLHVLLDLLEPRDQLTVGLCGHSDLKNSLQISALISIIPIILSNPINNQ